jgi:hypothetical protein
MTTNSEAKRGVEPMTKDRRLKMTALEGRQVSVALGDGSRIDDCQLVSAGRHRVASLWVFTNGTDVFVPLDAVTDIWETPTASFRAA